MRMRRTFGSVAGRMLDGADLSPACRAVYQGTGMEKPGLFRSRAARRLLVVSQIPTVLVMDPNGQISSRMIGFIPERFEQMLTERIEETRKPTTR